MSEDPSLDAGRAVDEQRHKVEEAASRVLQRHLATGGIKVRLFQGVGGDVVARRYIASDIDWPDTLQLPSRGDRVLANNEMIEVDHVEYMPGENPQVMIELVGVTNLRGESVEDWIDHFRIGWELR